ncbi:hypothetical protein QX776_03115 [Alteromonadaceae bacterium BrNp21-10]|nr:hypothetical protein [Alteromonadaceae bacterium BrNp21-10]
MSELEKPEVTKCRCGGKATEPQLVANCSDRWIIQCREPRCGANNIGQGLVATIEGWNHLSSGFYR